LLSKRADLFIASLLDILIEQFSNLINIDNRIIFLLRKSYLKEPSPQPSIAPKEICMDKSTVISIIGEILESYRQNPAQNHFEINVTGFVANNSGGIGFSSSPMGGGPGSTTIGMQSSMDRAQMSIAQSQVNESINEINETIINSLGAIIDELNNDAPDKSKISGLFGEVMKVLGTTATTLVIKYLLHTQEIEI
jgi:hypothetical protein